MAHIYTAAIRAKLSAQQVKGIPIKKTFAYFNKALFWRQPLSVTI
nr:MAG TPA: Putative WW-binding domain and destruction box [Caudoviricetes sp.]